MSRINVAANLITTSFCDVGTDHAELLIKKAKQNPDFKIIGSELNEGPLRNAQKNVSKHFLTAKIKLIKSDGLKNISSEELEDIQTLSIMGMGGNLIEQIINDSLAKVKFKYLVLQANNKTQKLIKFLETINYQLIETDFVEENKIVYIVNKFKLNTKNQFGNKLLYKSTQQEIIVNYYENKIAHYKRVLEKIPQDKVENRQKIEKKIAYNKQIIKGVFENETS